MIGRQPLLGARRTSDGRTVTEADIVQFAALSRDFSRLHTDAVYAARSVFGRRVGHGLLGLSLAEGLLSRAGPWRGIVGAWEWTFTGPFFAGDTLTAEAEVLDVKPWISSCIVIEKVLVRNAGEIIQSGLHALALAPDVGLDTWLAGVCATAFPAFKPQVILEEEPVPPSTAKPNALGETGVFFEDLRPGDRFQTPAFTIGDYDLSAFLCSIGDTGPWFHDRLLARRAELPDMLAPPLFGLALVEGLKYALAPDRGVGIPMASLSWRWRHEAPLSAGTTVLLEALIEGRKSSRSKHDRGVIAQTLSLRDTEGAVLQTGQHLQMFRRRPANPGGAGL
ncbi:MULTISPECIES: MaoC family dehydratase [unclassified Aurantimonas]|uniref:MaoC family dehydratase n=1 Tax=unclassified Aurantimonas TaxID=2638230 RepID=UPI002E190D44|nr:MULTISPECIES: MaoC/PaaZ C-terminal domain-containing protein [unclassified Aurantimonas]MEC5293294.1 MaoC/PaaZ C-terminal domain-containing protein [Aurantimonas sp. C2-3-R2]MEC5414388.1 MaoC/PaaZ C-terminal domain-containing protein [Aurantimonas sp. C2-4-R8]